MSFINMLNFVSYLMVIWTAISWITKKNKIRKRKKINKLEEMLFAGVIDSEEYEKKEQGFKTPSTTLEKLSPLDC
jgi:hypothetical protein